MYDIPELEKKWKIYRRKRLKKPIIFGLIFSGLVGGASFFALKNPSFLSSSKRDGSNIEGELFMDKNKSKADESQEREADMIIKKTALLSDGKNIKEGSTAIDLENATIVKPNVSNEDSVRFIGFDEKEKKEISKKYEDVLIPKKSTKAIKEQEMIREVEERFRATQDPQDSLWLARYYYKAGNYAKAETWAINTNNIDGEIEESWLIFAKARAKQGDRVEAIKVLQSYYDATNSKQAKELLDKLRRGKFK
jgi:tetratricopeptide (TPR) repeat protein